MLDLDLFLGIFLNLTRFQFPGDRLCWQGGKIRTQYNEANCPPLLSLRRTKTTYIIP